MWAGDLTGLPHLQRRPCRITCTGAGQLQGVAPAALLCAAHVAIERGPNDGHRAGAYELREQVLHRNTLTAEPTMLQMHQQQEDASHHSQYLCACCMLGAAGSAAKVHVEIIHVHQSQGRHM